MDNQGMDAMLPSAIPQGHYMLFIASPVTLSLMTINQAMIDIACTYVATEQNRCNLIEFPDRRDFALTAITNLLRVGSDDPDQRDKIQRACMFIIWLAWNDPHRNLRDHLDKSRWIAFGMTNLDFHMLIGDTDAEFVEVRDRYTQAAQVASAELLDDMTKPRVLH